MQFHSLFYFLFYFIVHNQYGSKTSPFFFFFKENPPVYMHAI